MRLTAILILALMLPGLVFSATHTVKLDGSGDFISIQAALDASAQGDTVLAYPGRYFENVVIQTNDISLTSLEVSTNNPAYIDSTIVDGMALSPCIRVIHSRTEIYIRGFSFTNGLNIGAGGGMLFSSGSVAYVTNCKVYGNTASTGGGINVIGASVSLSGVMIYNNYSVNLGGGLYCTSVTGFTHSIVFDPVNRCSIYNNRSGSGQDIYIQNAANDLNVYLDTFSVAVPTTYYAIYWPEGLADYQMHFDIMNAHHQEIDSDLYVSPDGDDANDGLSPASALRTIHEGIYRIAADSLSQHTVHLLPGTYSRTDNNQVFPIALKSWVIVQGSGMDTTVVVGEPHPLIPVGYGSSDKVFFTHSEPLVSIADMAITTQGTDNSCAVKGLLKGSVNLSNLRVYNLQPDHNAAISIWSSNDYESVWDNVIIENIVTPDMGLADIGGSISGKISNCKFRNAVSTYTSASVWAYPLVSFMGDRNLTFENCEFSNLTMSDDNSNAIQVGAVQFPQQQNNFTFNNCLFSNISSQGGIMVSVSSNYPNMDFTNCTFAGNESNTYTLMANGYVSITNSIFDNDTPYQIRVNPMDISVETSTLNIDYSCIKDGLAGILQAPENTVNFLPTSISGDPLFAGGPDIHDPLYYSLSGSSPCVDAGTPDITGLDLLPYDLAGNWRVWNGRIDMGCFEYGSEPYVDNDDPELPAPPEGIALSLYPNPFHGEASIRYSLAKNSVVELIIYNLKGQVVRTLYKGIQGKGEQAIAWEGRDDKGRHVASGIYLLQMNVDGKEKYSRKLVKI
ncbi:MAG TPA: FlgD immunoglobulin-like domain containing protein [Candidatus Syntrophosphaera sp.]|nr:FlgD immunoglobulin-like domain containing protein [Candidatus Syntrophosphaera sp.]